MYGELLNLDWQRLKFLLVLLAMTSRRVDFFQPSENSETLSGSTVSTYMLRNNFTLKGKKISIERVSVLVSVAPL